MATIRVACLAASIKHGGFCYAGKDVATEQWVRPVSEDAGHAIIAYYRVVGRGDPAAVGDVMILSPKAGGVGLTLTAANHFIHLSRWWNPAVEDQATDRAYRIGQERDVTVYLPQSVHPDPTIAPSSFDLKLHALMERKRTLSRGLLAPAEDDGDAGALFDSVLGGGEEGTDDPVQDVIVAHAPDAPPLPEAVSPAPRSRLSLRPRAATPRADGNAARADAAMATARRLSCRGRAGLPDIHCAASG